MDEIWVVERHLWGELWVFRSAHASRKDAEDVVAIWGETYRIRRFVAADERQDGMAE